MTEESVFYSQQRRDILLFSTVRSALGPPSLLSKWKKVSSPKVQRPEHEPSHSHTCTSEVTNAWSYISTRPYSVAV
jgi:hypothetical protein